MSQDFLSQEEVDALLKGVTGEAEETPAEAAAEGGIRPYELGRQERIVRGRMPTLELINERFARYLRLGLFNFMHRNAEVSVGPIRVQKYSDFVRNLVVPTNLNLIHIKPLRGTALLVFDPNLVFLVVDNMFGSDGRFHTRVEGREFTATEQRIIQGLLSTVFAEFEKSWKPIYPVTYEFVRSEMNTQFANIATPAELVVSNTFTIEFSGSSSEMHVCIPYSMIEPIRDILHSALHSEQLASDKRWTTLLQRQLRSADVELVVTLGTGEVTLGTIMNMKVGDILPLHVFDRVNATVNDVPVIEASYGVKNGKYALKIEKFLAMDEA